MIDELSVRHNIRNGLANRLLDTVLVKRASKSLVSYHLLLVQMVLTSSSDDHHLLSFKVTFRSVSYSIKYTTELHKMKLTYYVSNNYLVQPT